MSSLKQAFRQDYDHEVVRGHFEIGTSPDVHRYYCLVDPKTGKSESSGVAGKPFKRPDGMTGIKGAAVSFYSCADAERTGILVTTDYSLSGVSARITPPAPPSVPKAAKVAPPAAPATAPPNEAAAQDETPVPKESAWQKEVTSVYTRFIAAQNAHDAAGVSDSLLDSKELVWAAADGSVVWGHEEALQTLKRLWQGTWRLDPREDEPKISSINSGLAVLVAPMLLTQSEGASRTSSTAVRWAGVFVKTHGTWRIASIFVSAPGSTGSR